MVGAAKAGWRDRRFLDMAGTRHPIVQAPMAGAGGAALCIAAIKGGALGSLPCGMLSPERVRAEVASVRAAVPGPIALNFFCHEMPGDADDRPWRALLAPYAAEYGAREAGPGPLRMPFDEAMCETVEALRPEFVSFHFGLPADPLLARVRKAARVIGNAVSVAEARWLHGRGVDAIIAQGAEAGGHSGRFLDAAPVGLIALVPQIADAVDLPVIAAGGIGDARGIAAALMLGASAVQLGTAYLHCPEAEISAAHRSGLSREGTIVTNLMTGGMARGLPGRLTRELGPVRAEAPPYPLAALALAPIRAAAEEKGEYGFGPMWAGEGAPLGRALPAAALTEALAGAALALLDRRE